MRRTENTLKANKGLRGYTLTRFHAYTPTRLHALTLIELVIVCAIIAVLAGIVWVVMAPAREKARQTVCISNLTQIGHAFRMYRDDWDGVEPQQGVQLEYWELGLPAGISIKWSLPYLKTAGVWACPSDRTFTPSPIRVSYIRSYCNHDECALLGYRYDYCHLLFVGFASFKVTVAKYPDFPIEFCKHHNYGLPKDWSDKVFFTINFPDFSVKRMRALESVLRFSQ